MNPQVSKLIKITSIIAISAALGLEAWNIYLHLNDAVLPTNLKPVHWLATIALVIHAIEGSIAATKVARNKNPLIYGIYTFFVGYIGLKELSDFN